VLARADHAEDDDVTDRLILCSRLQGGEEVEISGPRGRALIRREKEGFSVRVLRRNANFLFRRFSEPASAIYWSYGQIKWQKPADAF
tara:strand:+ start:684 stop:944 length:261 start_codon:yes stop_codon:yes gene_type:complete